MDHIIIDLKTYRFTVSQMMFLIKQIQKEHPEWEVFMDGDRYAIVGRDRI